MTPQEPHADDIDAQIRPDLNTSDRSPVQEADAIDHATPTLRGERMASYELIHAFLPGKRLYMGCPEPYQFVDVPDRGGPGLQLASCPCPSHRGGAGTHVLNMSEVSLILECGPDRVWVLITIPARHRSKYTWLPSESFGLAVDEEMCGFLVSDVGR